MKYYAIKGKDTRKGQEAFEGYFTRLETINNQSFVGFSSCSNDREVKKYKTKNRCLKMLKQLENESKDYKYQIVELEGENK